MKKAAVIKVIFEDEHLLVINKPAGISATFDRTGNQDIIKELMRNNPKSAGLRLVHRLDKDTSGVMAIAKDIETQRLLTSAFEERKVHKIYLALVSGFIRETSGIIDAPLARSKRNKEIMEIARDGGKQAQTRWYAIANFGSVALLAVEPLTGRTHQIRVHLAYAGMPLAIDPVYGSSSPLMLSEFKNGYKKPLNRDESPLINRLTLHAYQLDLPQPWGRFIARPDKKFTAAIKMLVKHSRGGKDGNINQTMIDRISTEQPLSF